MNGCIYQTQFGRCQKFSDDGTESWCIGREEVCEHRVPSVEDSIRAMTSAELAGFLCAVVSHNAVNCGTCIAAEYCSAGHNGFIDLLRMAANPEERSTSDNENPA